MRTREEQIDSLYHGHYQYSALSQDAFREHLIEAERRAEQRVRAEIARDSERLDWLERGFKSCTAYMNGDVAFSPGISVRNLRGPDFRSAIDAAREVG
ncbi:hypothetical protein ASY01nite_14420 [Acetobacter syzygii]|uniref:hypothetical protein n=1 Tax=Acetobacter syzygii TaxID=146476 RepID=UPI0005DFBEDF|nr:hypothetical protein [Acetobacter syzygii]GAN72155.1 hypothetical protein Absy_030_063 [Acetobacter syzygii]GBR65008.1 hypothetical protein AA0483_1645 [Acetobacter syzygii NRIC 0483]GEL56376.1 hypothetical protein ASY01nite_14420 [Acetobacter syzygii]